MTGGGTGGIFPTPTGAGPASFTTLSGQSERYYQSLITAHWGVEAGQAYAMLNAANPGNTAFVNAQIFEARVIAQGLAKAIASAGSVVTGVPGAAAVGAGKAVNTLTNNPLWNAATAIPRFLSMLTSGALWRRLAEAAAGLILLAIGLNAMFKGKPLNVVTGAAGTLGRVAML